MGQHKGVLSVDSPRGMEEVKGEGKGGGGRGEGQD